MAHGASEWSSSGLETAELVVIDGANSVTREPREHFRHAAVSLSMAVVAVVLIAVLRRFRPALVPLVLVAAALPGLLVVALWRDDSPMKRPALAAKIADSLDSIQRSAPWPQPVRVTHESDDVLFPLGRYAVPTRHDDAAMRLELHGAQLEARCVLDPSRGAVCGTPSP